MKSENIKGRAIGQIGAGDVKKLEDANLIVVDKDAYVALRNKAALAGDFEALANKQRAQLERAREDLDKVNTLYSLALERAERAERWARVWKATAKHWRQGYQEDV